MKKSAVFLLVLFIIAVSALFSQESADGSHEVPVENEEAFPAETPGQLLNDDDLVYVIADFEFDITGRSRPFAIIRKVELKTGEEIHGRANLEEYIRDKTQLLINQRVLKDNAEITYTIGEQQEDGAYPVVLGIKVEDSWNIIALPRPQYSTNTGFDIIIKARDYNFLGTMNPLRIDLGYFYDENYRSSFLLEVDSSTPFRAFGYDWTFKFVNLFSYRPQVEEPFFYRNITGVSMDLPFRTTTFTFSFEEYLTMNEENSSRYKDKYGEFQTGMYMTSRVYMSWKIPTGIQVSRFGELTYTPDISATFNHELPDWPLQDIRMGPYMYFGHSLGFERIDWHANYREGLSVSFGNSYGYDFFRFNNVEEPLSASFRIRAIRHFIINKFFGISTRLLYRHWFDNDPPYNDQASDSIRGIADKAISADYMLSLNTDFPFRVLLFTPSQWFNNRKLRFFDLEFQISPVIDLAMYHDPKNEIAFHPKNFLASGGLELIIFSSFMRNLYARFSFAWNLRELISSGSLPGGENREISFTLGHFY